MSDETDDLQDMLEEAHQNIRDDRTRLEETYRALSSQLLGAAGDPQLVAEISEKISKVVDAMTRANAQLVEISKLRAKRPSSADGKGDEESMYNDIGDGFDGDREEVN